MTRFYKNILTPVLPVMFLFAVLMSGCVEQESFLTASDNPESSGEFELCSPEGMAEYLDGLPAVSDVNEWQNEFGPGITITTNHYKIHTTMLEPLTLSRVPGFMESAYSAYQQQLPCPVRTGHKFKVFLFDTREQWEDFTRDFTGKASDLYLKIKKGAYYLKGACVTYNIGRSRTFSVLAHEGWHQFNCRHFKYRLPSWLDEGIATLFEASEYHDGFFSFDPARNASRLGSLRKQLMRGKLIPLEELIRLNPAEVVSLDDTQAVMAFYGQAYALIRFLREEEYGKYLPMYQQMLLDAKEGNWPINKKLGETAADRNVPITGKWNRHVSPKLFEYYVDDCESLQEAYIHFCKKIVHNVRIKTLRRYR